MEEKNIKKKKIKKWNCLDNISNIHKGDLYSSCIIFDKKEE